MLLAWEGPAWFVVGTSCLYVATSAVTSAALFSLGLLFGCVGLPHCRRPVYGSSMAKGYDKHQARLDEISLLGKDLARRAGRRCELCGDNDGLRPYDSEPLDTPELSTLALLCARCRQVAEGRRDDPQTLRFLETAVWSEEATVKDTAVAILKTLDDVGWARDTLEMIGE